MIPKDFPCCIEYDPDAMTAVVTVADRIAANCSASNGQVLDALCVLLNAFIDESYPNEAIMPRVADKIARLGVQRSSRRNTDAI